jgi:hypothetical protein
MAIDAVFLHDEGYRYNLVYKTKNKFLNSVKKLKNASFVNAVDFERQVIITPSSIPDYRGIP